MHDGTQDKKVCVTGQLIVSCQRSALCLARGGVGELFDPQMGEHYMY